METRDCPDCGEEVASNRRVEIRRSQTGDAHWKSTCSACKLIAINQGPFEYTQRDYEQQVRNIRANTSLERRKQILHK